MESEKFSFKNTGKKFLTGAIVALLGALATYLQSTIPEVDFGVYTPVVVSVNSMVVNVIRNFIRTF